MVFFKHFNESRSASGARSSSKTEPRDSDLPSDPHGKGRGLSTKGEKSNTQSRGDVRKRQAPHRETDNAQSMKDRPVKRSRTQPSEEALRLSERLKDLSRSKSLDDALKVYRDPSNAGIRDGHHACIIIDCCARCGRIAEGETIVEELRNDGKHVSVETLTALIKGYAHSGQITKADALFESMSKAQGRGNRPNVRTLNTILRGCLWSASHVDEQGLLTGGIVTSEKAWSLCRQIQDKDTKSVLFDVSSYEYSVTLLCQALQTEAAKARIAEMESSFEAQKPSVDIPQGVSESLSISYLALAKSFATLFEKNDALKACKRSLAFGKVSKESLQGVQSKPAHQVRYATKQGKATKDGRREESNTLYRVHRLNEVEREVKVIVDMCEHDGLGSDSRQLARRLVTRLLVLSGGGTTDAEAGSGKASNDQEKEKVVSRIVQGQVLNTLFFSYGLQQVVKTLCIPMDKDITFLKKRDCNRILGSIGLQGGIILDDGSLDLKRIFSAGIGGDSKQKKRGKKGVPLEIELGSGFGDWIVRKAQQDPSKNFMSVELRADRVGQTFSRTALLAGTNPVDNLCIVGAESCSFLSDYISDESTSSIYINHPEPPTQTFGADSFNLETIMNGGPEPAHMISSTMISAGVKCLSRKDDCKLVIVTDNKSYGRLICATIVKVMRQDKNLIFPVSLGSAFTKVEGFPSDGHSSKAKPEDEVVLYEGQPDETIGYPSAQTPSGGATYFDRLWRSGAGSHSEKNARFVVVIRRTSKE